jgi:hypothetical protein
MSVIVKYFYSLAHSKVFYTILSGIVIFIISQYFLELVLKPRQKLKEAYSNLSKIMLTYQRKFYNSSLSDLERDIIRKASTDLLSSAWIVYRSKKKRTKFLEISKNINYIIAQNDSIKTDYAQVEEYLRNIEELDRNIITSYQSK